MNLYFVKFLFRKFSHAWRAAATDGEKQLNPRWKQRNALRRLVFLPESTAGIKNQLTFLAALNIFLSITALLGNSLILAVLRKESSLHPPSKIMFRNLAIADFCAGIIAEPVIAICWLSVVNKRWDICRFALVATHITGYILGSTSLHLCLL